MKLEASPAREPRRGWEETICGQRSELELLLKDSPSLRQEIPTLIAWVLPRALDEASRSLAIRGEQPKVQLDRIQYAMEEVLGDWPPEHPPPVNRARARRPRARNT